jgi:hypothetical protein
MKYFIKFSSIREYYDGSKEISNYWNNIGVGTDTLEDAHTIARLLHLDVYTIEQSPDGDSWHSKEIFATQNVIDNRIADKKAREQHAKEMFALADTINTITPIELQLGKAKAVITHDKAEYIPTHSDSVRVGVSTDLIFADGKQANYFYPYHYISKDGKMLRNKFTERYGKDLGEDTEVVLNALKKINTIEDMVRNGTYKEGGE